MIQNAPSIPSEETVYPSHIDKFDFSDLERQLRGILEKVKNDEAISYKQEQNLREIKRWLAQSNADSGIIASLIAMIDEILLYNGA